jgi:hypothetical protein
VTPALDVRPPPGTARRLRSSRIAAIAAVLAVGVAAVVVLDRSVLDEPTFIDRVSVDNPSGYDIHVTVAGEDTGEMPLGVARQHCVTTFQLVIDQGAVWRLSFRAQSQPLEDVLVDRSALERDGWQYRIPESVIEQLQAASVPLPPPQSCHPGQ